MRPKRLSGAAPSKPAVSMTVKAISPSLPSPSRRSRVTPGRLSTKARRRPTRRLNNVDFPTFGRPTMAMEKLIRCQCRAKPANPLKEIRRMSSPDECAGQARTWRGSSAREGSRLRRWWPGRRGVRLPLCRPGRLTLLRRRLLILLRPRRLLLLCGVLRRPRHGNLRRRPRSGLRLWRAFRFGLLLGLDCGGLLVCFGSGRIRRQRLSCIRRRLIALYKFRRNALRNARNATGEQLLTFARKLFLLIEAEYVELVGIKV